MHIYIYALGRYQGVFADELTEHNMSLVSSAMSVTYLKIRALISGVYVVGKYYA